MALSIVLVHLAVFVLSATAQVSCPNGWRYFGGGCFLFSREKATWINALSWCHALGGRLVEPTDAVVGTWVSNTAMDISREEWWIGLTDFEAEGNWIWADSRIQTQYTNTMWQPGEPNGGAGAHCGQLNTFGKWNDDPCTKNNRFICEQATKVLSRKQRRMQRKQRQQSQIQDQFAVVQAFL